MSVCSNYSLSSQDALAEKNEALAKQNDEIQKLNKLLAAQNTSGPKPGTSGVNFINFITPYADLLRLGPNFCAS